MIRVDGKPLLLHNIELCRKHGIKEIFINTHQMPEKIRGFFEDGTRFGVEIKYSYEAELLGTAGALNNFRKELDGENFFVIYGDNYSDYDLGALRRTFEEKNCMGVIGFHFREDVSQSGVGEFDDSGRVTGFVEKPAKGMTSSHWVNAGAYYLSTEILAEIPDGFSDFGRDIFPALVGKGIDLYGVRSEAWVRAFDTPELLKSEAGAAREA